MQMRSAKLRGCGSYTHNNFISIRWLGLARKDVLLTCYHQGTKHGHRHETGSDKGRPKEQHLLSWAMDLDGTKRMQVSVQDWISESLLGGRQRREYRRKREDESRRSVTVSAIDLHEIKIFFRGNPMLGIRDRFMCCWRN
ncbi:hypothetical protein PAXRUDRAFT_469343 [Paxillus rubicundulus Ve08.2h10]|uniref:Uncharacterized protein n=1 Tax=Paxillus rubicundulus Ve08.2h10 TaxID=930991 RepID=A0A0D0DAJ6_9AGAM|nr:hypothetical protein PAXRUDRAFT_469343 [Paxillus rubicundulus Ve08.2h10]